MFPCWIGKSFSLPLVLDVDSSLKAEWSLTDENSTLAKREDETDYK